MKSREQLERELADAKARISWLEQVSASDCQGVLGSELYEHHPDMVLYIDALTGDIRWVNKASCAFYGYSRAELASMNFADLDVAGRDDDIDVFQMVRERTCNRFLLTQGLKSGELRNVEIYMVPLEMGGRDMACAFVRDVTRLTAGEISAEKNAVIQDVVLSAMDIVPFYCRNQAGYEPVYIGPSVKSVTGFLPERFYSDPLFWLSRIHENDKAKVMGRLDRLSTTGSTRCEYRWQVQDGSYRWFSLSMRLSPCEESGEYECNCIAGLFWDITDRKRTEKALLEREERYRTVADFAHDWEFWIGPDGEFLYVSPSFERVTGYKPEELKKDSSILFESIVHPRDRERFQKTIMGGIFSDEPISFDFRIVTKEGDVRWIGHVSQPVYDDKGDSLGRRASNRDITELKETLGALRDKNQFVDSMMANSPASIYAKDVDGRYLFGNTRFMKFAGKSGQEVLGKTDFGLFDNDVAELFKRGDRRVITYGESLFEEIDLVHGGRKKYWTSSKFPLQNAEGKVLGICGISQDVTELREAEASLRRLTRAVEQSPVSIIMTDMDGCIRFVNPYFKKVSGYTEKEVLGRKLGFMLAEQQDGFYEKIYKQVLGGEDWHGEIRNRNKAGDTLWENVFISPVRDSRNRITNLVTVKEDVTERKRIERLERDVEHIVRHDLKSPIMSFIWVPRTLRKAENITDEQALLLGDMEQSAHRLLRMVNLSLDIFKMEEGTYKFVPEELNILRVIHNVLQDLQKTTRAMRVGVEVRMSGKPVTERDCLAVQGEEVLCHSMMSNLIKNAVEASPSGGCVTVECQYGEFVSICICNDMPVPEEILDGFFDKYTTHGKKFGTGLGTYSARLMAETQGGFIDMQSSSEFGTSVTVTFPAGS